MRAAQTWFWEALAARIVTFPPWRWVSPTLEVTMSQKAPAGLSAPGQALWRSIAGKYELRADESAVLVDACRTSDMIDVLEKGLEGQPLMVKGSQGQEVINPLISELRQYRAARAALLRQLKLPDESSPEAAGELSARNRTAANARWSRRGA